jgi:hypothetical protein
MVTWADGTIFDWCHQIQSPHISLSTPSRNSTPRVVMVVMVRHPKHLRHRLSRAPDHFGHRVGDYFVPRQHSHPRHLWLVQTRSPDAILAPAAAVLSSPQDMAGADRPSVDDVRLRLRLRLLRSQDQTIRRCSQAVAAQVAYGCRSEQRMHSTGSRHRRRRKPARTATHSSRFPGRASMGWMCYHRHASCWAISSPPRR